MAGVNIHFKWSTKTEKETEWDKDTEWEQEVRYAEDYDNVKSEQQQKMSQQLFLVGCCDIKDGKRDLKRLKRKYLNINIISWSWIILFADH